MPSQISLAYYTVASLNAAQAIAMAAELGYSHVGLRLIAPNAGGLTQGLLESPALLHEAVAQSRDTGVGILDLEFIWIDETFQAARYQQLAEAGRALGARHVLVGSRDPDLSRLADSFGALCALMAPYGLAVSLEFMPYSLATVHELQQAADVLRAADSPENAGILVDALHFSRSRGALSALAGMPPAWFRYAQLCDAPAQIPVSDAELVQVARGARLLPGEGGIDLAGLVRSLPAGIPWSLEIPNDERTRVLGPRVWAQQALEAARKLAG